MKLSQPKKNVFWIATAFAAIGIIGELVPNIPFISTNSFWFAAVGFVLLWLGNVLKGF